MNKLTLTEWVKAFDACQTSRDFENLSKNTWYDWFCQDHSLVNKMKRLAPLVRSLAVSPRIDPDKVYIFMKNNLTGAGRMYDSISIQNDEQVLIWVTPKSAHTDKAELVIFLPDEDLEITGTITDVKRFLKAA